jgi:hypothetical protein
MVPVAVNSSGLLLTSDEPSVAATTRHGAPRTRTYVSRIGCPLARIAARKDSGLSGSAASRTGAPVPNIDAGSRPSDVARVRQEWWEPDMLRRLSSS